MTLKGRSFVFACLLLASPWLRAELELTFLANEGVLLSDGEHKVLIDGMIPEQYAIYQGLTPAAAADLAAARGLFSGIDVALASHQHFDHLQPDAACAFMQASPSTLVLTSPQVKTVIRERCKPFASAHKQLQTVVPSPGVPHVLERNGIRVEIFPLSHGVGKYAALQNYGHLVTVGGVTVLHMGDAETLPADFVTANLANKHIDVALLPFWFLLDPRGKVIIQQFIPAKTKVALHIPDDEVQDVTAALAVEMPEVIVFSERMKSYRFQPQ